MPDETKKKELSFEEKYRLLRDISNKIRNTLDLDEILNHLLDSLQAVIHYDAAGIFVLSRDIEHPRYYFPSQVISGIARRGYDNNPPESDDMLSRGKGIVGHVINTAESHISPDVRKDDHYVEGRKQTLSEITVPIMKGDRAIGALDIESDNLNAYGEKDLEILNFFTDAASISIEKSLLHLQILRKKKMEEQMRIAGEVQANLLPASSPHIDGYDISGICIPNYEIGGDYFDYIPLKHNLLGVAVADVSGDGIPAAMIITAFRALLRSQAKNNLKTGEIMHSLNDQLFEFTRQRDFVTAFYGILDSREHTFTYTNCGHNPPLVFRKNGDIEKLSKGGPSLSVIRNAKFRSAKAELCQGDRLILYTDGVTEIFDDLGEEFGEHRLIEAILKNNGRTSSEMINGVIEDTKEFSGSDVYRDDYTIVVISRTK